MRAKTNINRADGQEPASSRTVDTGEQTAQEPERDRERDPLQSGVGNQALLRSLSNSPGELGTSVILDDRAASVAPGQMRRSEFLAALEQAVSAAADEGLSPVGRTAQDCPYIRYMFDFYRRHDVDYLRRSVFRHAPEAQRAATANEYIALVSERARHAADVWAATGRIEWQAREFTAPGDPRGLQAELGPGQPLDGGVRAKAESTMQEDLSGVRVHTGGAAAGLTRRFQARAFTFGREVVFAPGQYQPGTPVGDAMIAHELAHVVQQNQNHGAPPEQSESAELERDANQAATGTLMAIWGAAKGAVTEGALKARPALRSGLRVQRCSGRGPLQLFSTGFSMDADKGLVFRPGITVESPAGPVPGLGMQTQDIESSASVIAKGGTNAEAQDWQAGYIQTVFAANPKGEYLDAAGAHNRYFGTTIPGPVRDGTSGEGRTPPWYNDRDSLQLFPTTDKRLTLRLLDVPRIALPMKTDDQVGSLDTISGKESFGTWLIVRQRSTSAITYLNWATWEVDFAAKADLTSTGRSVKTGQGPGKGSKEPVLDPPIANDVAVWGWTP